MEYYDFQPDLTKTYPILSETKLILTDNVDPVMVQDIILNILPKPFSILGTKVRLILVTVVIINDMAYWDLTFEYPEYDKALPILEEITQNAHNIEDAYNYYTLNDAKSIYKLSFKVD